MDGNCEIEHEEAFCCKWDHGAETCNCNDCREEAESAKWADFDYTVEITRFPAFRPSRRKRLNGNMRCVCRTGPRSHERRGMDNRITSNINHEVHMLDIELHLFRSGRSGS